MRNLVSFMSDINCLYYSDSICRPYQHNIIKIGIKSTSTCNYSFISSEMYTTKVMCRSIACRLQDRRLSARSHSYRIARAMTQEGSNMLLAPYRYYNTSLCAFSRIKTPSRARAKSWTAARRSRSRSWLLLNQFARPRSLARWKHARGYWPFVLAKAPRDLAVRALLLPKRWWSLDFSTDRNHLFPLDSFFYEKEEEKT